MAQILEKVAFFHIPKTGGNTVRKMLNESAEVLAEFRQHPNPRNVLYHKGQLAFTFVRHPLNWYRSFFAHRDRNGWRPHEGGIDLYQSKSFNEWVTKVCEEVPHYLTAMYGRRITDKITFVGKQENLIEDLVKVLKMAKQPFDEKKLREVEPVNVGNNIPDYDPAVAEKVMKSESQIITKYNYSTNINEVLSSRPWIKAETGGKNATSG